VTKLKWLKIVMLRSVEEASPRARLATPWPSTGAPRDRDRPDLRGEVHGRAPDDFDFGNSPFEISGVDFHGKTIIPRTSAGTQGIVTANRAKRLYAASLVTAEATVRAILAGSPDPVCLVAMGDNGVNRTDEDELCAIYIRNRLEGRPGDPDAIRRLILAGGEVQRFHDPVRTCIPRMSTSRSMLIAAISRSGLSSRMGDRSRVWRGQGQPDAEDRGDYSLAVGRPSRLRGITAGLAGQIKRLWCREI
jgi:hypothetical protein